MPALRIDRAGFRLDGEPFRIISGGLHYFRIHPDAVAATGCARPGSWA